jgi:hypothetical protein
MASSMLLSSRVASNLLAGASSRSAPSRRQPLRTLCANRKPSVSSAAAAAVQTDKRATKQQQLGGNGANGSSSPGWGSKRGGKRGNEGNASGGKRGRGRETASGSKGVEATVVAAAASSDVVANNAVANNAVAKPSAPRAGSSAVDGKVRNVGRALHSFPIPLNMSYSVHRMIQINS